MREFKVVLVGGRAVFWWLGRQAGCWTAALHNHMPICTSPTPLDVCVCLQSFAATAGSTRCTRCPSAQWTGRLQGQVRLGGWVASAWLRFAGLGCAALCRAALHWAVCCAVPCCAATHVEPLAADMIWTPKQLANVLQDRPATHPSRRSDAGPPARRCLPLRLLLPERHHLPPSDDLTLSFAMVPSFPSK